MEFDNDELPTLVPPVDEDPLPVPPFRDQVGSEGAWRTLENSQVNREISGGVEMVPGLARGKEVVGGDVLEEGLDQRSEGEGQRLSEGVRLSTSDYRRSSKQDVEAEHNGADTLSEKSSQGSSPTSQKGPPERDGSQHGSSSGSVGHTNGRVSSEISLEGSGKSHGGQDDSTTVVDESGSSSKDPGAGSDASTFESDRLKCSEDDGCGLDKVQSPDGTGGRIELCSDPEEQEPTSSGDGCGHGDSTSDAEVGVATETGGVGVTDPSTGELGVAASHKSPEAVRDQPEPNIPAGDADSGESRTNVHTSLDAESPESVDSAEIPASADSAENQPTADSATTSGGGGGGGEFGEASSTGEGKGEEEEEEDDQVLTFEEFKMKMREQEGGQGQQRMLEDVATVGGASKKILSNYASFDCGAKVIETNPEAQVSGWL